MQNGSCIEFRVEVEFGNNEVKMLKNQTNNHHVQKDTFEFVEDGDHDTRSMFIMRSIKNKGKLKYYCIYVT